MAGHDLDTPYRGGFVGSEHRFALTVYFEDTDAYGIVYYANYLKFMERARSDFLRAVGVDQAGELAATGSAYAVVEVNIRYRKPARLGDDLKIVSTVDEVRDWFVGCLEAGFDGFVVAGVECAAHTDRLVRTRLGCWRCTHPEAHRHIWTRRRWSRTGTGRQTSKAANG